MVSGEDDGAWRPPAREPRRSEVLSGYEDLVEVGRGGDSVVYRARQVGLRRDVAIKVVLVDDEARAARFAREVEITVDLGRQHPNIVTVLATGITETGRPAIVMDYVEGGTLQDRLVSLDRLPVEEVVRVGEVLADALAFAHERGILHRDVKPQNVLVLPTSWVLTDFGIARLIEAEHTSSAETFTYRHAAPQVLDGYSPTAADDVWSLGSTLYTLLDGRPPFSSDDLTDDSALSYLRRARTEAPRPLSVPGTDQLAPIIERCLAKDPTQRWASAADLRDALQSIRSSAWEPGGAQQSDQVRSTPAAASMPSPPAPTSSQGSSLGSQQGSQQGQTPQPPEHEPVALSAAAQVQVPHDVEPTGTLSARAGLPPESGAEDGPEAPAAKPPRRSRIPVFLGVAALVLGLGLGAVAAALRGGEDDPNSGDSASSDAVPGPIPTLDSEPPDAPDFRGRPDPDLEFVLTDFDYDGTTLQAEWIDSSDGEGIFFLVQVLPEERLIADVAAGEETLELTESLPRGYSCYFMVVKLANGPFGHSNRRCLTNG